MTIATSARPILITLDAYECLHASQVGLARRIRNRKNGHAHRINAVPGGGDHTWDKDIDGACAEMAVAKYLDRFWTGEAGYGADVSTGVQVRQTGYPDGCLLVRPDEAPDQAFVLAIGVDAGPYRLAGWLTGEAAQQAHWLRSSDREGGELHWVPQAALWPMGELRGWIQG